MNEEKIRELARQAGLKLIHDETLALGYLNTPTKKFAELIIRECHNVVFKNTGAKSALNILDHFGIEE